MDVLAILDVEPEPFQGEGRGSRPQSLRFDLHVRGSVRARCFDALVALGSRSTRVRSRRWLGSGQRPRIYSDGGQLPELDPAEDPGGVVNDLDAMAKVDPQLLGVATTD